MAERKKMIYFETCHMTRTKATFESANRKLDFVKKSYFVTAMMNLGLFRCYLDLENEIEI